MIETAYDQLSEPSVIPLFCQLVLVGGCNVRDKFVKPSSRGRNPLDQQT